MTAQREADETTPLLAAAPPAPAPAHTGALLEDTDGASIKKPRSYAREVLTLVPLYLFICLTQLINIGPVGSIIGMLRAFACADYFDRNGLPQPSEHNPYQQCTGRGVELEVSSLLSGINTAERLVAAASMAFVFGPLIQNSRRRPMLLVTVASRLLTILPFLFANVAYPYGDVYRTPEQHSTVPTYALNSPRFGVLAMMLTSGLSGLLGADQVGTAVCRAMIIEFSSEENKSSHLVHASLANMAALIFGPAFFGWFAERFPTTALVETNRTAYWLAAGCCLLMLLLVLFVIPETRPRGTTAIASEKRAGLLSTLRLLLPYHGDSRLSWLSFVDFSIILAMMASNSLFTYISYIGWTPVLIGYLISLVGLVRVVFLLFLYPATTRLIESIWRKPAALLVAEAPPSEEAPTAPKVRPQSEYSLHGLAPGASEADLNTQRTHARLLRHWRYVIDRVQLRAGLVFEMVSWVIAAAGVQYHADSLLFVWASVGALGSAVLPSLTSLAVSTAEDIHDKAPPGDKTAEAYNVDNVVAVLGFVETLGSGVGPAMYTAIYYFSLETMPSLILVVAVAFYALAGVATATL